MKNTHNSAGGTVWPLEAMQAVAAVARRHALGIHLDGARLWNAHVYSGVSLSDYAATADSIAVCFSKGLGAPVGSALCGSREFIEAARLNRKRFGGAMRQAGIIAAGALFALEHNFDRLVEDHENAALLAGYLGGVAGLEMVHPVQTNIVIVSTAGLGVAVGRVVETLKERGVLCNAVAADRVRFVTHLDVSSEAVRAAGEIAARVLPALGQGARGKAARDETDRPRPDREARR